ncbi:MAG: chemotaxis protein CheW [Granulosicoccus sp.]|nr:chemotaxis protein CheW [Granulosicoccus sp.]
MGTRHLLFGAGGLSLAVPAELVKTIHEQLTVQAVAGTRDWFRGLGVAHGKLLPVTDMGAFFGRRSSTGHTLEIAASVGMSGLQVDTVYGLSNMPISEIPLNRQNTASHRGENPALSSRAIVQDERVHRLLDVAALLQSPAFLNIAENSH